MIGPETFLYWKTLF